MGAGDVMGAGSLAPVARRWKGQLNELAKAARNFEFLPEADHNTLAGTIKSRGCVERPYHDHVPARAVRSSAQPPAFGLTRETSCWRV